jgi:sugar/nucleoside kinase (ribokinase family)
VEPASILPEVEWRVASAPVTTTFENRYSGDHREQRVLASGRPIKLADIPSEWRWAPVVLLAPVFHDVDPGLSRHFAPHSTLGLGAQGWLRRLEGGAVRPGAIQPRPEWLWGDAVFVSEEDVEDVGLLAAWQQLVPVVVLTRARRGCTVWDASGRHDVAAIEAEEVDPTGAGDVFAAAFLLRYHEGRDAVGAARFATAAAALAVGAPGLEGIGDRQAIEAILGQPFRVKN